MKQKDTPSILFEDTGDVSRPFNPKTRKHAYVGKLPDGTAPPLGAPTGIDWLAAMRWLVVKVSKDGLPHQERGAQAEVERWLSQWFINQNFNVAETSLRTHVRQLFDDVKTCTDI